jgi:hypothetical protein
MTLPPHIRRLDGSEPLHGPSAPASGATVLDFWRWAFSDLSDNTLRGVFAEWLVARLLDISLEVRVGWAVHDLTTPEGWRIEVKSAAYRQSWHALQVDAKPSAIVFNRLHTLAWTPETGEETTRSYHADIYVLCHQKAELLDQFDALNVTQWDFYVLTRAQLEALAWMEQGQQRFPRSIGIATLKRLVEEEKAVRCAAADLRATVARAASRASPAPSV